MYLDGDLYTNTEYTQICTHKRIKIENETQI